MWNNGMYPNSMPTATQPYGYPMPPYTTPYQQLQQQQLQQQAQMQQAQQPNIQQANQQVQAITNTNKIYVSGIDEVRNRPLPFNSDMLFLDNDKPLIYQKIVDSKGQYEVKAFSITPYNAVQDTQQQGAIDLSGYAEKKELGALQNEIQSLKQTVQDLSQQITSSRSYSSKKSSGTEDIGGKTSGTTL